MQEKCNQNIKTDISSGRRQFILEHLGDNSIFWFWEMLEFGESVFFLTDINGMDVVT